MAGNRRHPLALCLGTWRDSLFNRLYDGLKDGRHASHRHLGRWSGLKAFKHVPGISRIHPDERPICGRQFFSTLARRQFSNFYLESSVSWSAASLARPTAVGDRELLSRNVPANYRPRVPDERSNIGSLPESAQRVPTTSASQARQRSTFCPFAERQTRNAKRMRLHLLLLIFAHLREPIVG